MKDEIILIDYEEKYADVINKIEENQWGELGIGDIRKEITEYTHVKLVKIENEIAGIGYGKQLGDLFYLQAIVIRPEYQHNHIGSVIMDYFINYAKNLKLTKIVCECILIKDKMNAEGLMKKYNFKEIIRIKDYWGFKHQEAYCKECDCKPCECTNVVYVKELN